MLVSWANIAVGDWDTARTENKQQSYASDCGNGESSVEWARLEASTRYNLPEVQGLVSSPKSQADNSKSRLQLEHSNFFIVE